MKRVTGIGGIFFNSPNPAALVAWYKDHLGFNLAEWGGASFDWADSEGKPVPGGSTLWTVNNTADNPFAPSTSPFMINYRVADLKALVEALKAENCNVLDYEDSEYGKFAHVLDPDGNKVELWEPSAEQ